MRSTQPIEQLHYVQLGAHIRHIEVRRHTMRTKPGEHLSQRGVTLARRIGDTTGPFSRVITSTVPRAFETAIAMGFAVDEQVALLSTIPDGVNSEVDWNAGFAAWEQAYRKGGSATRFSEEIAGCWRAIVAVLHDGEAALIITHGGIIEAGTVACFHGVGLDAMGEFCHCCEGVRLAFEVDQVVSLEVLRVTDAELRTA